MSGATIPRCPDWALASGSDVHATNDIRWFRNFTPFLTHIYDGTCMSTTPTQVYGVGNVDLVLGEGDIMTIPRLHLSRVLYAPSLPYNVVGAKALDMNNKPRLSGKLLNPHEPATFDDIDRILRGYCDWIRKHDIKGVIRPPVYLDFGRTSNLKWTMASLHWPAAERARESQEWMNGCLSGGGNVFSSRVLDDEEKHWLIQRFDGVGNFFELYGLNFLSPAEAVKGTQFARFLMCREMSRNGQYHDHDEDGMRNDAEKTVDDSEDEGDEQDCHEGGEEDAIENAMDNEGESVEESDGEGAEGGERAEESLLPNEVYYDAVTGDEEEEEIDSQVDSNEELTGVGGNKDHGDHEVGKSLSLWARAWAKLRALFRRC